MFSQKKDIFFDLDHTIWDFDRNAEETLQELYFKYRFDELFQQQSANLFIKTYTVNNHRLWGLYHHNKIDKATLRKLRFSDTFTQLGVDPNLFPIDFEEEYLAICPTKTHLFPNAHDTLRYLQSNYNLHLISNGFREACEQKIQHANLGTYFKTIVISEIFGINKPDPRIFAHAIQNGNAQLATSVMIGDSLDADIRGAQNFGMDAIYFNPNHTDRPSDVKHMIHNLLELTTLF